MGRSSKPEIEYRFFDHVRYIEGFLKTLGLRDITLVIHDWGSALGFDYVRYPTNIKAIAFLEAILMPLHRNVIVQSTLFARICEKAD